MRRDSDWVSFADGDGRRTLNLLGEVRTDRKRPAGPKSMAISSRGHRAVCADSTRAARPSTIKSPPCTKGGARLDPDAALYWLCRMLDGGAIPVPWRRLIRMAVEDIGLADPPLQTCLDALCMLRATAPEENSRQPRRRYSWPAPRNRMHGAKAHNAARKFVSAMVATVPMHLPQQC